MDSESMCMVRGVYVTSEVNKHKGLYYIPIYLELVLEESPKWKVLKDVLEDIDKENSSDRSGNVLFPSVSPILSRKVL